MRQEHEDVTGQAEWELVHAVTLVGMAKFDTRVGSTGLDNDMFSDKESICGIKVLDQRPDLRMILTAAFIMYGSIDARSGSVTIFLSEQQAYEILDLSRGIDGIILKAGSTGVVIAHRDIVQLLATVQATPALPPYMLSETHSKLVRRVILDYFLPERVAILSSTRAESLQQLALHADSLSLKVTKLGERTSKVMVVSLNGLMCGTTCRSSEEDYHGKVYCIEVPSHVFYVRSSSAGVGLWTGNSSRHGQKGTVGILYRQEDMPFTRTGLVPDIIINPHAIPSRMTVAQLMECIMGKACVSLGTFGDATPFSKLKVGDLTDLLQSHGIERHGNEIMYNSRTGEQLNTTVFIGPTFYQRLKHMVDDKIHSRAASGPVVMMTRQPAEGRARDGGLRLGEMEIECNWAHGTMQFLKERFMECSDNYRVHICRRCGMMATANPEKSIYSCKACKNINHFAEIRIPYACKLFLQEVQVMNIGARFLLSSSTAPAPSS